MKLTDWERKRLKSIIDFEIFDRDRLLFLYREYEDENGIEERIEDINKYKGLLKKLERSECE